MKKSILFLLALLLVSSFSFQCWAGTFKIGASVNYYLISDPIFKELYSSGGMMFGGFLSFSYKMFELRTEFNTFQMNGNMSLTEEEIKFSMTPIVVGLRVFLPNKTVSPYLGGGLTYCSYKEELPARFEPVSESVTGFHFESGSYFILAKGLLLDLNVRYSNLNAESFADDVKIGGIRAGLGVGYRF
ncbi:porin family protein [Candidatus Woesearchaeota archaeon]|nr:porin family protein [Candidatus Woesearchaeota archaeon]